MRKCDGRVSQGAGGGGGSLVPQTAWGFGGKGTAWLGGWRLVAEGGRWLWGRVLTNCPLP